MFDTLAKGFRQARNRLAGLTELTDSNIDSALREVRLSLLEADVEIGVVKAFLARIKEKAIGQTLQSRVKQGGDTTHVSASDLFIKICHDQLEEMMDYEGEPITFAESGATGIRYLTSGRPPASHCVSPPTPAWAASTSKLTWSWGTMSELLAVPGGLRSRST